MSSEYIRISVPEQKFGQKNLLSCQMELITSLQHLREYSCLRREELVLQIALKKKSEETVEIIKVLDKLLPHAHFRTVEEIKKEKMTPEEKKELTLEDELAVIRNKLQHLNAQYR